MPQILDTINSSLYCAEQPYLDGDGVNLALWNETSDAIRFHLATGVPLVNNFPHWSKYGAPGNAEKWPVCLGFQQGGFNVLGGVIAKMYSGFELPPGFQYLDILSCVHLPLVSFSAILGGAPIINKKLLSIKFTVENISRGTTQVILHAFASEIEWNAWTAFYGLAAHGTPAQYVQSIGENIKVINYSVEITSNIQPLGNNTDPCRIQIELLVPPYTGLSAFYSSTAFSTWQGMKNLALTAKKVCQ